MNLAQTTILLLAAWGTGHPGGHFWIVRPPPKTQETFVREVIAEWCFKAYRADRVVVWTCQPFRQTKTRNHREDAYLNLAVTHKQGPVRCRIVRAIDETQIVKHKNKASVAATVEGTGIGRCQLRIGMPNPFVASGRYETVVHMTVTSP